MQRFRFIIACLLLLVLPLQGMAAALRLSCLAHEADSARTSHVHLNASAHEHQHEHHAAAADHDDRHTGHNGDASSTQQSTQHSDASCSVCAACCHGALASVDVVVASFSVPSYGVAASPTVALRLRATPPPDKPPRV